MSCNANKLYPAVDVDKLAQECKDAISQDLVHVVVDMFGYVHSIYRSLDEAKSTASEFNKGDPSGYWSVESYGLR
jgi:hypothetical protein